MGVAKKFRPKKKIKATMPKGTLFLPKTIKGLRIKKKIKATMPKSIGAPSLLYRPKKRIKLRKSYGQDVEYGPTTVDVGGQELTGEQLQTIESGVEQDLGPERDYAELVKGSIDYQKDLEKKGEALGRQIGLAETEKQSGDAFEKWRDTQVEHQKVEEELNLNRSKKELNALNRALKIAQLTQPELLDEQKTVANILIKHNKLTDRFLLAREKIKKINSLQGYRTAYKETRRLEDQLEDLKEEEEKIAKRLDPYGIKIKIAPLFGSKGLGIKFPKMEMKF